MRFVDTNVLLYAISRHPAEAAKAERALSLLNEPSLALSVQVLQEFYVQSTRESRSVRLTHQEAIELIDCWLRFPVQQHTVPLMQAAFASRVRFRVSYWDAAIVEAARALGCDVVLSEDLQHGQNFDGVRVVDPFL